MNANNPLLSIIVPAYNVEKYIEECLESLQNQSYPNIEIIVIEDGSADKTKSILLEYQNRNPHVVVFCQENKGVSEVRNFGIAVAKGEYITFVDGDDAVNPDTYSFCMASIEDNDIDVIQYPIDSRSSKTVILVSLDDQLLAIFKGWIHPSVCNKIYKKESIKLINFKGRIGEDLNFNLDVFSIGLHVKLIDRGKYNYRCNSESATRTIRTIEKMSDRVLSMNRLFLMSEKRTKLYRNSVPYRVVLLFEIMTFNFRNIEQIETFQIDKMMLLSTSGIILRSIPIIGYRKFIYYLFLLIGRGPNFGNNRLEQFFWNLILDK